MAMSPITQNSGNRATTARAGPVRFPVPVGGNPAVPLLVWVMRVVASEIEGVNTRPITAMRKTIISPLVFLLGSDMSVS